MALSTYGDIIDDKVAEWKQILKEIEEKSGHASSDKREQVKAKLASFRPQVDDAIARLHALNEQETAGNTVEIKDQILKIFDEIDKEFPKYKERTPYML